MTKVDIVRLAEEAFDHHRPSGSRFWSEISKDEREGWVKATEHILERERFRYSRARGETQEVSAPSKFEVPPLKEGVRVALAMRRGVVTKVTADGFWIQLDCKPADIKTWIGFDEPWLEERFEPPEPTTLRDRIAQAINATSSENDSNTPDFILAQYLVDCLDAFDRAVVARAEWYGRMDHPASAKAPP